MPTSASGACPSTLLAAAVSVAALCAVTGCGAGAPASPAPAAGPLAARPSATDTPPAVDAPSTSGSRPAPDAPAPPSDDTDGTLLALDGERVTLSPLGRRLSPDVVAALGDVAITSATEALTTTGVAAWALSLHLETAADIDVTKIRQGSSPRSGIMFSARNVDLTLEPEAMGRAFVDATWPACGGALAPRAPAALVKARRDVKQGTETRSFAFVGGPDADALVDAARRANVDVSETPVEHDAEGRPDATFQVSLLDQRPRGVVVLCLRRLE